MADAGQGGQPSAKRAAILGVVVGICVLLIKGPLERLVESWGVTDLWPNFFAVVLLVVVVCGVVGGVLEVVLRLLKRR